MLDQLFQRYEVAVDRQVEMQKSAESAYAIEQQLADARNLVSYIGTSIHTEIMHTLLTAWSPFPKAMPSGKTLGAMVLARVKTEFNIHRVFSAEALGCKLLDICTDIIPTEDCDLSISQIDDMTRILMNVSSCYGMGYVKIPDSKTMHGAMKVLNRTARKMWMPANERPVILESIGMRVPDQMVDALDALAKYRFDASSFGLDLLTMLRMFRGLSPALRINAHSTLHAAALALHSELLNLGQEMPAFASHCPENIEAMLGVYRDALGTIQTWDLPESCTWRQKHRLRDVYDAFAL